MISRQLSTFCLLLGVFLVGTVGVGTARAQEDTSRKQQEYFVQQNINEALFIRINTFEADIQSSLLGPEGELLAVSSIGNSHMVPVFQFVDRVKNPRQLDIRISSSQDSKRSKFSLGLTRLTIWDDRSATLAQAYQNLSFGTERINADTAANWTVRINSLINAARVFHSMGMKELGAWSNYLAAHFIHFHLHDYNIALDMSRDILANLKGSRWQEIVLATLQLQSDTLIRLREAGSLRVSTSGPDKIQTVLLQVAELAQALDFQYERARAIKKSGTEYAARSLYPQALEQFQMALKIADSISSETLATEIRESIVQAHTNQGDTPASSTVLQAIEAQLAARNAGEELAINLLHQGRLLINGYQFPQAIGLLSQALEHENNSATRRQIDFELARAFYETGDWEQSLAYLLTTGIYRTSGILQRPNSAIDIAEGLRILANIYRTRADYPQMQQVRSVQGQYLQSGPGVAVGIHAGYLYERGLDEKAQSDSASGQAQSFFKQSYQAATGAGLTHLQHLSRLQYCALVGQGGNAKSFCSQINTRAAYESISSDAGPRQVVEAMFLRAQYLLTNGKRSRAATLLDSLVGEVHFLQITLPGVLGAWYWERHVELFETYLELAMADEDQGREKNSSDGLESLVALSKIRHAVNVTGPASQQERKDIASIRNLFTQLKNTQSDASQNTLKRRINEHLKELREPFQKEFDFLSKAGIRKYLASLRRQEGLLTYHISSSSAHVWLGRHGKVQRHRMERPAEIYKAVQAAGKSLSGVIGSEFDAEMNRLGEHLLTPVAGLLPETIYWVPAGPLLGLPLDAMRLGGRYLVEDHDLVNLLSFPIKPDPVASLQIRSQRTLGQRVFLAGHPQDYSGSYASQLDTSPEIRVIADIFVGLGLQIVQGQALLKDEFTTDQFKQANMIHLSMPGLIDLARAERSGLELSEARSGLGREILRPADIRKVDIRASLVFLASTRVTGTIPVSFHSQMGLVSSYLQAGANSVIASLWATNAGEAEGLILSFYHHLEESENIVRSLGDSKRESLQKNRDSGPTAWSSFQLFIP